MKLCALWSSPCTSNMCFMYPFTLLHLSHLAYFQYIMVFIVVLETDLFHFFISRFHTCPFMSSKNTNGATTKIHHSTTKSKEGKILLVLLLWIIIGFINNMNLNLCSLILSCPEDPSVHVRVYYLSCGAWAMFNRTKSQKIIMMN